MNFIDLSSWQGGLDLGTIYEQNPQLDGVIVKATGGTKYVNAYCDPWVQWLISHDKPWGFYHFLEDGQGKTSGKKEAEFFVEHTRNYFGHGVPFVDWEGEALKFGADYVKDFVWRVYELTGVKCGIYLSRSQISNAFGTVTDFPLWVAQYADNKTVYGFVEEPWKSGSIAPWQKETLRQYTSAGRLNGWSGRLDLNKCYLSRIEWDALASGTAAKVKEPEENKAILLIDQIGKLLEELRKEIGG